MLIPGSVKVQLGSGFRVLLGPAVLRSRSRPEPVLFGRSRGRFEEPAPAPP